MADARLPDEVPQRVRSQDSQGPAAGAAPGDAAGFAAADSRQRLRRHGAAARALMIALSLWQAVQQPVGRVTAQLTTGDGGMEWSAPQVWWWIIAIFTVGGAISTITRRNNIAAVMSLVATFFGLAAMYAMLSADFLAVLEVLVYAGAIMTLFVFVIMVLNRDEAEPWAWSGVFTKII